MLKRVVVAVLEGVVVGGGIAAGMAGLGLSWSGGPVIYGAALVTGVTIGLVAGKPPWASSAKLEALLKSAVGAFIAPAAVYGARKWLPSVSLDLGPVLGSGALGDLPRVLLPLTAIAIAVLLEIDDAVGPHATVGQAPARVATTASPGEIQDADSEGAETTEPGVRGPGARGAR
ncbi:MAG TPA: hypothetical protein VF395_16975 [Polyangiaceae bacterium]